MKSAGVFVAIVGPNGAGKDSVIRGLIARRVVTRPADAYEDHKTLRKFGSLLNLNSLSGCLSFNQPDDAIGDDEQIEFGVGVAFVNALLRIK